MSCEFNNNVKCECSNVSCPRHGKCCECVAAHRGRGLPQCLAKAEAERIKVDKKG